MTSDTTWALLEHLEQVGACHYGALAQALNVTVGSAGAHARLCVKQGWAERRPNEGRPTVVAITKAGRLELQAQQKRPTVRAVVDAARKLRERAGVERAQDPYFHPYCPTDVQARNLSYRHGPGEAIELMRARAAAAREQHRQQTDVGERAQQRHERRQMKTQREIALERARMTPGQRLDQALANASLIAGGAIANLTKDIVTGTLQHQPLPHTDALALKLRAKALQTVEAIERAVDHQRRRACDFERSA